MRSLLVYCSLLVCLGVQYSGAALTWPKTYQLSAILKVPSANLSIPYDVWVNGLDRRVDFYGGMTKIYAAHFNHLQLPKWVYMINPESTDSFQNKMVCHNMSLQSDAAEVMKNSLLPATKKLELESKEDLDGIKTNRWSHLIEEENSDAVTNHTVWTRSKSVIVNDEKVWVPVRYEYRLIHKGIELIHIQHFYTKFTVEKPDSALFELPKDLTCPASDSIDIDPVLELVSPEHHSQRSEEFQRFKSTHGKQYKTKEEHFKRFNIFKKNLRYIQQKNRQQSSYKLAVNRFTDMEEKEKPSCLSKINREAIDALSDYYDEDEEKYHGHSDKFDWRLHGAITPVKDQATCGSCYAFSSAAVLESTAYISRGCVDMEEVSEQALIDCSWAENEDSPGNDGCEGGDFNYTMEWVNEHGLPFRKDYGPYLAMPGYCHMNHLPLLKIRDYVQLPRNVSAIKEFIRTHGPITAGIDFPRSALFFVDGIYDDPECSSEPDDASHGVAIVGYGHHHGRGYWIVKNSWGPQWGDHGYFKLSMDSNTCGAANFAFGVVFNKSLAKNCLHTS